MDELYTPLNERSKQKATNLMHAARLLHVPLMATLLRYGPDMSVQRDMEGHDLRWHIEHNYWSQGDGAGQIAAAQVERRKAEALRLLEAAEGPRSSQEEAVMDAYEERFDVFITSQNDEVHRLYRSTDNDLTALFEAIKRHDFQSIMDLVDKQRVDPNMPSKNGTTPLHFACEFSGALVIKFLMDRGAFPFHIQSGLQFPRDMLELNDKCGEEEKIMMRRLLDVHDVDHDPFAMTDVRVVEVERITLFASLFVRWLLVLLLVFVLSFGASAYLTNRFQFAYEPVLTD